MWERKDEHWLPVLDDPATLGCIEGQLRTALPGARIEIDTDPWSSPSRTEVRVCPSPGEPCRSYIFRGQLGRAEAIITALEDALEQAQHR